MKNKMKTTKKILYASLKMETKLKLNTGEDIPFGDEDIYGAMFVFKSKEGAEKRYGKDCPLIQIGLNPKEIKEKENETKAKTDL